MLSSAEILGPAGRIAARLKGYEHRGEQLAMAEAVDRAVEQSHHLIVEAGTGVGKSFAYLVPAILTAASSGGSRPSDDGSEPPPEDDEPTGPRRVIISTHTISLQEQ